MAHFDCPLLIFVDRLILGYAYPAYECFKIVELNKPDIEQLLFWCQYWCVHVACYVRGDQVLVYLVISKFSS